MAEELQGLLDRINREGIAKADAESARIVAAAQGKAAAIIKDADKKAAELLHKAEEDSKVFAERGRKALEQAARDVILSVGGAVNATMAEIVKQSAAETMTVDVVKQILPKVIETYCGKEHCGTSIEVLVNPAQKDELTSFFMAQFAGKLREGVTIKGEDGIVSGFRVSVVDKKVQHDFTGEAIAGALCQLLRPHLGEIVKGATRTK